MNTVHESSSAPGSAVTFNVVRVALLLLSVVNHDYPREPRYTTYYRQAVCHGKCTCHQGPSVKSPNVGKASGHADEMTSGPHGHACVPAVYTTIVEPTVPKINRTVSHCVHQSPPPGRYLGRARSKRCRHGKVDITIAVSRMGFRTPMERPGP